MNTLLMIAITFGWAGPEVLAGEPPLTEYRVYMHHVDNATTNVYPVPATEYTCTVDDSTLAPGQYEVWVTAVSTWEYSNTVSGIHSVTNESDRSEQLWMTLPEPAKPAAPLELRIEVTPDAMTLTTDIPEGTEQMTLRYTSDLVRAWQDGMQLFFEGASR